MSHGRAGDGVGTKAGWGVVGRATNRYSSKRNQPSGIWHPEEKQPVDGGAQRERSHNIPTNRLEQRLVLATGPGNWSGVWVWTGNTVRFDCRNVQKPVMLLHGGPNPVQNPSTYGFRRVWLDPSGPISGFAYRVALSMVAFRYPTVNRKILMMVHRCYFWTYWPPFWPKYVAKCSLTHYRNECQQF